MNKTTNILTTALLLLFIAICFSCANIVAPTGGPEDHTPPKVLKCIPANRASNFKAKKIEIVFDEFISFSDFASEVIISPFFNEKPDFRLKGKKLIIEFNEKLKDNATYTMFFGTSIKDYNESNILENYEYVFSTGTYVDSLSVRGYVFDAFTHEPQKEIFVSLYDNDYDSVIYKEKPLYITKTNSSGYYMLNNLKPGKYRIYGLKDVNSNYLFDMPNETIAFCDTLVVPHYFALPKLDSAKTDTSQIKKSKTPEIKNDSAKKDSLKSVASVYQLQNLYMFEEADTNQKLIKSNADRPGMLKFIFRYPVKDFELSSLDKILPDNWIIKEFNKNHDTINCWFNNFYTDSLFVVVKDGNKIIDTCRFNPKKVDTLFTSKGKNSKSPAQNHLYISNSAARGKADYNIPLSLSFSHPISSFDKEKFILKEYADKDTIGKIVRPVFAFTDSTAMTRMLVNFKFKEKTLYNLLILPGAFTDIFKLKNDSVKQKYATTELADYGVLLVNIKYEDTLYPFILQLLDEKNNIIEERYLLKPQKQKYDFMKPGKYKVRAFQDKNHNKKWDTGNYLNKKQPEKVFFYSGEINVKENWDTEIEWSF